METIHKILHYPKCTFKNEVINKICWRKCGETKANQAHIFFFCPGLKSFWHSVIMTLINIFNTKVTFNPIYIIIGKSARANSGKGSIPIGSTENCSHEAHNEKLAKNSESISSKVEINDKGNIRNGEYNL